MLSRHRDRLILLLCTFLFLFSGSCAHISITINAGNQRWLIDMANHPTYERWLAHKAELSEMIASGDTRALAAARAVFPVVLSRSETDAGQLAAVLQEHAQFKDFDKLPPDQQAALLAYEKSHQPAKDKAAKKPATAQESSSFSIIPEMPTPATSPARTSTTQSSPATMPAIAAHAPATQPQ